MATLSEQYNTPDYAYEPVANVANAAETTATATTDALSNAGTEIADTTSEYAQGAYETAGDVVETTQNVAEDTVTQVSSTFGDSNTFVGKAGFLLLCLVGFLIVVKFGIQMITSFLNPTKIEVVKGMLNGNDTVIIYQDPSVPNAITLPRSNNETEGLEFTWSFWIYIESLPDTVSEGKPNTKKQGIFSKGDGKVNNGPGVYLGTDLSNAALHIIMDTVVSGDTNNTIKINNIPLKNWVHVAIRCEQTTLDVYVNGVIASRLTLSNLPKQNYNDVIIAPQGGFNGKLSNLRYYSHALNIFEINYVVYGGPNKSLISSTRSSGSGASYLSRSWYSSNV
jgi:hypothetical protein